MARVWIEDRETHADYQKAMVKWKAAKKAGSKRQPPGRWRVRWYGPDGSGKAKTFQKLPQAEAEVTAITTRLDKGSYRDPALGKELFVVVAEEWHGSLRKARTTTNDYRDILDLYVLPYWGKRQVGAIVWQDAADWLNVLCDKPGAAGHKLGAARVRKVFGVLRMVLQRAVKAGRIVANPASGHEMPTAEDTDDHVYLTHRQVEALAAAAGRYRLLVLVLAYTGIRWGEASALAGVHFDLDRRRLRITRAYSDVDGVLEIGPVKTHEKRSVPLPRSVVEELRPLAERGRADLLFTAPGGGPLRIRNFRNRDFDRAVEAAGLGGLSVTPHKLRHTAASLAIASGADVKVVQTMLGHKSATMTLDLYGHLFPDRLDEVANALDAKRERMLLRTRFASAMLAVVERRTAALVPAQRAGSGALVA